MMFSVLHLPLDLNGEDLSRVIDGAPEQHLPNGHLDGLESGRSESRITTSRRVHPVESGLQGSASQSLQSWWPHRGRTPNRAPTRRPFSRNRRSRSFPERNGSTAASCLPSPARPALSHRFCVLASEIGPIFTGPSDSYHPYSLSETALSRISFSLSSGASSHSSSKRRRENRYCTCSFESRPSRSSNLNVEGSVAPQTIHRRPGSQFPTYSTPTLYSIYVVCGSMA